MLPHLVSAALLAQTFTSGGVALDTLAVLTEDFASDDRCTAVAAGGGVAFAAGGAGSAYGHRWLVRARELATGAPLWTVDLGLGPGLAPDQVYDVALAPDGATLFVVGRMANGTATESEATALALDAGNGSLRWLVQLDSTAFDGELRAVAVAPDGQRLAVTGHADAGDGAGATRMTVAGLTAANGQTQWTWSFDADPSFDRPDIGRDVIFSADGARVFATGSVATPTLGDFYGTFAFAAATGTELWSHLYTEPVKTLSAPVGLATNGATVVVAGRHAASSGALPLPGTIALDAATGALAWVAAPAASATFDRAVGVVAAGPDYLVGESAGPSFFSAGWAAARLVGATGARAWETEVTESGFPFVYLEPDAVAYSAANDVFVLVGAQNLTALDPTSNVDSHATGFDGATGALLWRETWAGVGALSDVAKALAIDEGRAAIGGSSFVPTQGNDFAVRARDVASGQLLWADLEEAAGPAGNTPYAGVVDPSSGDLFVVGGLAGGAKGVAHVARVDGESGATLWTYEDSPGTVSGGRFSTAALSSDGQTLFAIGSTGKDALVVALRPTDGALLWRRAIDGPKGKFDDAVDLALAPDGSRLYVLGTIDSPSGIVQPSDEKAMLTVALDPATGADLWSAIHDPTDEHETASVLALAPDGLLLYAVGTRERDLGFVDEVDVEVVRYDAANGAAHWVATFDTAPALGGVWRDVVAAARVSDDGARLHLVGSSVASCCNNGRATLWTARTTDGAPLVEHPVEIPGVDHVPRGGAISFDGSMAVVVGEAKALLGGAAVGFDLAAGTSPWGRAVDLDPLAYLDAITFGADGTTAYAAGRFDDRSIPTVALDVATGDELWRAGFEPGGLTDLVITYGAFGIVRDDARRRVWTVGYGPQIGTDVDGLLLGYADPTLLGDAVDVSLAAGGSQTLTARAGPAFAGDVYFLLGTLGGTVPGVPLGDLTVPLNPDAYLTLTLTQPNSIYLPGSLGVLDSLGRADLAVTLPPGTNPLVAGLTAHHAFVAIDLGPPGLAVVLASNPIALGLVP